MRMNRVIVRRGRGRSGPLPARHRPRRGRPRCGRSASTPATRATCSPRTRRAVHGRRRHQRLPLPRPLPTPVLAVVDHRAGGAAAGVMVTASHNPPKDNGYKVYLGKGAQIVPPADTEISACIDAVGPLADVPLAAADDPLDRPPRRRGRRALPRPRPGRAPRAVGRPTCASPTRRCTASVVTVLLRAFERAGFPAPGGRRGPVRARSRRSRRSRFPNPEEPGRDGPAAGPGPHDSGADIALANDPDADRLGAAIPSAAAAAGGGALRGDEIGWLLGRPHPAPHRRATTGSWSPRSSRRRSCGEMAAAAGVHYAETFTGFKWIAHAVLERPEQRFVFGYEQALGYLVTRPPLDKDGITAAVLMAEVAAVAKAEGVTLEDRLADLEDRFGRHVTAERSVPMNPAAMPRSHGRAPGRRRRPRWPASPVAGDRGLPRRQPPPLPPRGRGPRPGPPERHRAEGEALRRGGRRRPGPQLDALAAYLGEKRLAGQSPLEPVRCPGYQRPNWRSPASPRPGTM